MPLRTPSLPKAAIYELTATLLVFLVGWAWGIRTVHGPGLAVALFVVFTLYYYIFHLVWPSECQ
jgi:hypothetical protein